MEERLIGTISRGVRAPIIREGDDLAQIVVDSVLAASKDVHYGFEVQDRDIVAVTEAVVARAQGNYATIDNIATDIKAKCRNLLTTMGFCNHTLQCHHIDSRGQ